MKIPLCVAEIDDNEINKVVSVLKSGWLAHGPVNEEFEEEFAKYIGVKHAISMNSCTSALDLAIRAQDLKGEVIVPSFTFAASANSIVTAGCKPVFAEVNYDTFNIDIEDIKKKITDKTCAIMPVHYAGQPCVMDEIMELAEKHELEVIEDSAETIGGMFDGKVAGSFATGCFSFYPTKNMTTGEGGMLTTDDEQLANKIKALKAHGIESSTYEREKKEKPWLRAATYPGFNFRLCDVLAALGVEQLKKLDWMNEKRIKHSNYLNENLSKIEGIKVPATHPKCKHVFQMYSIKVEGINRDRMIMHLRENEIGASVHFEPPVHIQPYYQKMYPGLKLPVTERLALSEITLPMFPALTKEQLDFMINVIEEGAKKCKEN